MMNKEFSNLLGIVLTLTIYTWSILFTLATNCPLPSGRAKESCNNKMQLTAQQEFMLSNMGNMLNGKESVALMNFSAATAWHLPPPTLGEGEARAILDENIKMHNNCHYGINKTNSADDSNNDQKQQTTPFLSANEIVNTSTMSKLPRATASSAQSTYSTTTASTYFERVEMHEALAHTKTEKLLLHRNKRYLLFPEGSSFQLVFDLIIPIVDYTNFAIMGITCAVAWELPSKPPSDIIENFRKKLNDGTFGLSRRNDSVQQPLVYIKSLQMPQGAVDGENIWMEGASMHKQNYFASPQEHQRLSSTIATTYGHENSLTNGPQPWLLPTSNNLNYNNYMQPERIQQSSEASAALLYGQHPALNTNQRTTFHGHHNKKWPMYKKNNNHFAAQHHKFFHRKNPKPASKWNTENWSQKTRYNKLADYGSTRNWWQGNKNHIQKHWQQKAPWNWTQHKQNFQMKYPTDASSKRTGRNRKILKKRPKHLIYPIFGKRRRRRHRDDFNKMLHDIHAREHLLTRQKLYRKIEQLYQTRGQNGTACVLRALCETAKLHSNAHYNAAPQSFVMELLRSIFALPQDTLANSKASPLHLDGRYADAVSLAQDDTQSCSEHYSGCEYSINYGA